MNEKKPSHLIGLLTMDRLFAGSKSEGLYPVLHAEDGRQYRLHYKGDLSLNEKTLSSYDGKTIQVNGDVDNLRGHLRIVLTADNLPLVIEESLIAGQLASEATSELAAEDASKTEAEATPAVTSTAPPDLASHVAPEAPNPKANSIEE
jgi:hypothetical protein